MARKKLFWEPYIPFMKPNRFGHRYEALALALFGGFVILWGAKKSSQLPPSINQHYNPNLYENFVTSQRNN